jgi:hypothetical protein
MFSPIPPTNTNNSGTTTPSGRTTPSSIATSGRTTPTATASSVASAISDRVTSTLHRSSSCEVVDAEELSGKTTGARNTGREEDAAAYAVFMIKLCKQTAAFIASIRISSEYGNFRLLFLRRGNQVPVLW